MSVAEESIYSASARLKTEIRNGSDVSTIAKLADEWNIIYMSSAYKVNAQYSSDLDLFLNVVRDALQDKLTDPALKSLLQTLAPKMYALLQAVPGWVSPLMAFLSALQPSNIASDAVQVHLLNLEIQEEIRKAFDRASGEPLWFSTFQNGVLPLPPPEGPTLRLQ